MVNSDLEEFVFHLKCSHYFLAHEALERRWKELKNVDMNESNLVKGYINAATSFELFKRGKTEQSRRVWTTFLKYKDNILLLSANLQNNYIQLQNEILQTEQSLFD